MNQYGQIALTYYRTYRPTEFAQMSDPQEWATQVGRQVMDQVVAGQETAPMEPEASYLQTVEALKTARLTAETQALQELVYLEPEPGTEHLRVPSLDLPGWEPLPRTTPAR